METPRLTGAVNLLTGLIRAYELHADANPGLDAETLRQDADAARGIRDSLLQIMGADIRNVDTHGASSEWTSSIGMFTRGNGEWKARPSRDPRLTLEQLRDQE
ncbi:hypothetical protein [Actinomadura litoris]|uniref:hypothetical protein n=1 Tax=Actinomadura litoris TaxID=2678616 RepID=UPI001FA7D769|nr:hypothetical protein [Actinomadura litoris]